MIIRQMLILIAVGATSIPAMAASDYLASLAPGDLDYDLAVEMERHGCTMTEEDILEFLGEKGADIGMSQSVILDLGRLGDLRWDGKGDYTLVNWGKCP